MTPSGTHAFAWRLPSFSLPLSRPSHLSMIAATRFSVRKTSVPISHPAFIYSLTLPRNGFRTKHLWLVTTLVDPRRYPAADIADLYRQRWVAELFLRDIKSTLGMDVLRGKSPAVVLRELTLFWIAYNLIRSLIAAAASPALPPTRFSFKSTLSLLLAWLPAFSRFSPPPSLRNALLASIARCLLPFRTSRSHPRARKRRPKSYQLLTRPRSSFSEIPHRNRYAKILS